MQLKGSRVLVLGGWGLVGSAICHQLMKHEPSQIIVTSLRKSEAEDAVAQLYAEYKNVPKGTFVPYWGNVFTRKQFKDDSLANLLTDEKNRKALVQDIYSELSDEILQNSTLYSLIQETKPDCVIDCINTATGIAYQDIYSTQRMVAHGIETGNVSIENVERLMASDYVPQLIRHIQILQRGLIDAKTTMYVKVGTSGTGGMGLNIPYTHSEERPSRVLLAKASVGGAQSLLLFLMARTPNGPLVKEIKPTAAIAWKKIAYDKVMRKGSPIPLVDMPLSNAHSVHEKFEFKDVQGVVKTGEDFKSVFIDTGENGIFSKGEFSAIGALGQMELVTPEEIAECVVFEIIGGNTGHDIVQGLDSTVLGATYRAGMLYNNAVNELDLLEKESECDSIAFEMLGPPRLSKLLFEAYILKQISGSYTNVINTKSEELSKAAMSLIEKDSKLRSQMVSIGLVILLPDGKTYLRGEDVKIPARTTSDEIPVNHELIEKWCAEAWVDLRPGNFDSWKTRLQKVIAQSESIPKGDTSSRYTYTKQYWNNYELKDLGKLVAWIFEHEDHGWRFKH